jgi:hypothetical protein
MKEEWSRIEYPLPDGGSVRVISLHIPIPSRFWAVQVVDHLGNKKPIKSGLTLREAKRLAKRLATRPKSRWARRARKKSIW